jgi:hypothetical protein
VRGPSLGGRLCPCPRSRRVGCGLARFSSSGQLPALELSQRPANHCPSRATCLRCCGQVGPPRSGPWFVRPSDRGPGRRHHSPSRAILLAVAGYPPGRSYPQRKVQVLLDS